MEFGEKLRKAREDRGMTQQSLADKIFVTRQCVSRWECGERYPDLRTVEKLSEILCISIDQLLLKNDNKEETSLMRASDDGKYLLILYTVILSCFLITTLGSAPMFTALHQITNRRDLLILGVHHLRTLVESVIFLAGFNFVIRERIQCRSAGVIAIIFWGMESITALVNMMVNMEMFFPKRLLILYSIIIVSFWVFAIIASFCFYFTNDKHLDWKKIIYAAVLFGVSREIYSLVMSFYYSQPYGSTQIIATFTLRLAIYITIAFQTKWVKKKR